MEAEKTPAPPSAETPAAAPVLARGGRTFMARPGEVKPQWFLVDATGQPLGRLAARLAVKLMGKDKPTYTPHLDTGDFVVVINAERVRVHPRKLEQKTYRRWSGYQGGLKEEPLGKRLARKPEWVLRHAVRLMLPKNLLAKRMLRKLKVYAGPEHRHAAQGPRPLAL